MQRGSLKIKKNRKGEKVWRAQWREPGIPSPRTRILGRYADLSRAEARAELDRIIGAVNAVAKPLNLSGTLRSYIESEYLVVKNRTWKDSTRATTEQIIETHIATPLGSRPLNALTRRELQAHLDSLAAAGLSESVVGHVRWQLVAIFAMAKSDGLIVVDPTGGLVTPRCKASGEKVVISIDDIRRAAMVLDIRERLIFRLAVCQGLRPGEIVGLQLSDIRDGILHISRRVYRGTLDSPKSSRGRRKVPLTQATAAVLDQYVELLQNRNPEAWLFPSETGNTPLSYSNCYRRNIEPALRKIGLEHVNFQVLRRTWVTEYGDAETDPHVRASIAGHSVDVHENEYRQPKDDVLRRSIAKLGDRLQ